MPYKVEMELAGRRLSIETGKLAKQANGAVTVRYGDTVILATATMSEPREGLDFFPLLVDFEEKNYAAGQIPVSFYRREGKPADKSILVARLTDRPLRPLFPEGMRDDVQIILTPFSADPENNPDILCPIGASAALCVSDIPFNGPVGSVRVGLIDDELVINPTYQQMEDSRLDLVMASTRQEIIMVEAGGQELPEEIILAALRKGHAVIQDIVALQEELVAHAGRPKAEATISHLEDALVARVEALSAARIRETLGRPGKHDREATLQALREEVWATLAEDYPDQEMAIKEAFEKIQKKVIRRLLWEEKIRVDGRGLDEIRPLVCEVGLFPRTHGSALFQRGETQALSVTTLGNVGDEKTIDWLTEDFTSRYMHQYNFPPYSVGEVKPLRAPSRRDIGHGALAQRALEPVLPDQEDFPYTIRVVSEILESNGSSSMASVCGSSLSLMDAGVPIKRPVAGISIGLLKEGDEWLLLTDIEGLEDAAGDMDFKVAGTEEGITALQLDLKISGLPLDILQAALERARQARLTILEHMRATLPEPRPDLSPYAPRITIIQIDPEKIGTVIGPGGKTIKQIQEETDSRIDIEDDGRVFIAAVDAEAAERARKMIESLVKEIAVGEEYVGKVVRIMNFGAFVELTPGQDGLIHISRLSRERVARVEDVVKIGDLIPVRVFEIDSQGRINLERTDLPKRGHEPEPFRRDYHPPSRGEQDRRPEREDRDRRERSDRGERDRRERGDRGERDRFGPRPDSERGGGRSRSDWRR